jgi:G3E family GTPase
VKLTVFSGFLGAGKTKLILSLAQYLMKDATGDRLRLAILENEIGETGIDDKVLESAGYSVTTMLSGCVCCTLNSNLIASLNDIAENLNPEYGVLEPTGIAVPDSIMDTIKRLGVGIESSRLVTTVDAKRFTRLLKVATQFIKGQIRHADAILINKCDLVDDTALEEIEKEIRAINADASLYRVSAINGVSDEIWKEVIHI